MTYALKNTYEREKVGLKRSP